MYAKALPASDSTYITSVALKVGVHLGTTVGTGGSSPELLRDHTLIQWESPQGHEVHREWLWLRPSGEALPTKHKGWVA